jgi:hypothetical protein
MNKPIYVDVEGKEFPVRIFTRFENIEWDIHNEEDWKVIEEAIQSMKRRWINGNYSDDATHKNCETFDDGLTQVAPEGQFKALSKSEAKLFKRIKKAGEIVLKEDEKLFKELAKEQKGCGKVLDYGEQYKDYYGIDEELHCGDTFKGKLELCQKCKENAPNQSQQNKNTNIPHSTCQEEGLNGNTKQRAEVETGSADTNNQDEVISQPSDFKRLNKVKSKQ